MPPMDDAAPAGPADGLGESTAPDAPQGGKGKGQAPKGVETADKQTV